MTYEEIVRALRDGKCESTEAALERVVEDEAKALAEMHKYKLRDGGRAAREAAREFYAEDITEQLTNPYPPTPNQILAHRRMIAAWAIAQVLVSNNLAGNRCAWATPDRQCVLPKNHEGHHQLPKLPEDE